MSLSQVRRAIRPLLNERLPADAMTAYYALHHEADKTQIVTLDDPQRGFVTLSRTGIDLFRPLVTMRLPLQEAEAGEEALEASATLLLKALPAGASVFAVVPEAYMPLLRAFAQIQSDEQLHLYALPAHIELKDEINVLVTREDQNGLARFIIKQQIDGRRTAVAAAGLNWQSPHFAEIAVRTRSEYRQKGFGRSVVHALAAYLSRRGRTPLYAVAPHNTASIQLAQRLGFQDTGHREHMLELEIRANASLPTQS